MRVLFWAVALSLAVAVTAFDLAGDVPLAQLPPFSYDALQAMSDDPASYGVNFDANPVPQGPAFPFEIPHAVPTMQQRMRTPAFLVEQQQVTVDHKQKEHVAMMTGNGPDEPDEETLKDAAEAPEEAEASDNEDPEDTLPIASPTERLKTVGPASKLKPIEAAPADAAAAASGADADDAEPTPLVSLSASADAAAPTPITGEARFAEEQASGTDSTTTTAAAADSSSAAFKIEDPPSVKKNIESLTNANKVARCKPGPDGKCVASWDPNTVKWSTKTVPAGTFKDDPQVNPPKQSGSPATQFIKEANQAAASGAEAAPVLSSNAEIRKLEEAYYQKKKELDTEEKWVNLVRKTIKEYELKVARVNAHIWTVKDELRKSKRNIIVAIKKEKEKKLTAELRVALASLHKLNSHSTVLGTKLGQLTKERLNLGSTISRIKNALGVSDVSQFMPKADPYQKAETTGSSMRFREVVNDEAKDLFKNLAASVEGVRTNAHTKVVGALDSALDAMPIEHRIKVQEKLQENLAVAKATAAIDRLAKEYQ